MTTSLMKYTGIKWNKIIKLKIYSVLFFLNVFFIINIKTTSSFSLYFLKDKKKDFWVIEKWRAWNLNSKIKLKIENDFLFI